MKFAFIATEKAAFPARLLCRTLQVRARSFTRGRCGRQRRAFSVTNAWDCRSRRSTRRAGNGVAVHGFTPSCGIAAAAPGASAWRA